MTVGKKLRIFFSVFLIIAALCLSVGAIKKAAEKWQDSHIDSNALFFSALEEIRGWQSYRYVLDGSLTLKNRKTAQTALKGEQDSSGNLHIFGEIMDTETEVYQFGSDHYRFLSASKEWKLLAESPLTENGILLMLICPQKNFDFVDTISVDYTGVVREDGEKYYRFVVIPKEGFHVADAYFTDFKYRIDISAETKQITAATIHAVSRTKSENTLFLQIRFCDINRDFILEKPL